MQQFAATVLALEPLAMGCEWVLFALAFFSRKRPPASPEQVRDPRAIFGLILQLAGFGIIRLGDRTPGSPFLQLGAVGETGAALVAVGIMTASVVLTYAAVRTLGKQWSLAARLVQGHQLVREGPYGRVRHPIYTAMFGMLLGTAIAVSRWQGLVAGSAVFLLGTWLRVHAEEHLLMTAFGDAYRDYVRAVPALIPWWPTARRRPQRLGLPPQ
jgi:protein-S-isoprenylcysteine O-methyltransferase Ste14